jgi:butyrate kinase
LVLNNSFLSYYIGIFSFIFSTILNAAGQIATFFKVKSEILKIESTLQKRMNQKKHYRNIMDGFNSQNNDDLKKLDELKIQLNKYDAILSPK